MKYYIVTKGRRDNQMLFLVDRNKTKSKWWTTILSQAIGFDKKSAAKVQLSKLVYNDPQIVDSRNTKSIERENEMNDYNEHPFSSEGLGQW